MDDARLSKEEFFDLVWRLDEILMNLDYLRGQIGNCPNKCDGLDAQDQEGLCPDCCDIFAMVMAEEDRLAQDKEYNEVMRKLKEACDEDKTGQYERILKQSREGKVIH